MLRVFVGFVFVLLLAGCGRDGKVVESLMVSKGDTVIVEFQLLNTEGFRIDGTLSNTGALRFVVGNGQVIAGFDKGVVGMTQNEEKTIKLLPEDAYGSKGVFYCKNAGDTVYVVQPNDTLILEAKMSAIKKQVKS